MISNIVLLGQSNEDLAMQYFYNKEYEKASVLLVKLHKSQAVKKYYDPLLVSYYFLEDNAAAEKTIKRHIKKNPERPDLIIDLGCHFKKIGKESKAQKTFKEVIDLIDGNSSKVLAIGNRFFKKGEYELSAKSYLKGRKINNGSYPYAFELVQVYEAQGNLTKMAKEAIGVLEYGDSYLDAVKGALANVLDTDQSGKKRKVVKDELLKAVQSNSENNTYSELLIWLYLQDKNFQGAFIQSRSLMKRNDENGNRLMKLGELCRQNNEFEIAINCYKYIIKSQKGNYHYRKAKRELVEALNEKINKDNFPSKKDLLELQKSYEEAINELGKNSFSISLMKGLAHLKGFYFGQKTEAIKLLEEAIALPRGKASEIAACKVELADIYVMHDEIWEAVLLYGQVNADFKHEIIGHKAKLKSAKAYFYAGEFEFAKSQLDILKAATTKIISNDAIQLSVLISDNLGLDTALIPLKIFAKADLLSFQNQDSAAIDMLDSLVKEYPNHISILDDAYFMKAKLLMRAKKFDKAIEELQKTINYKDLLEDDAIWQLANIYEFHLQNKEEALKYYEELLFNHTGSIYSVDARKRYRKLRGDNL